MKFLFCAPPAAGHFNPTVPVAKRLMDCGHEVVFCSGRRMEKVVRALGFRFVGNDPDGPDRELEEELLRRIAAAPSPRNLRRLPDIILPRLPHIARHLLGVVESESPDAALVDVLSFGPLLAVEKTGIPWASSSMFPGLLSHPQYPPFIGRGLPAMPTRRNLLRWRAIRVIGGWAARPLRRRINALRGRLGLPLIEPGGPPIGLSPFLYLSYTIPELEYGRSDWPPQVHLVGASLWDAGEMAESPSWLAEVASDGQPLVYATLGTVHGPKGRRFVETVVKALQGLPLRAVITTGDTGWADDTACPPNIRLTGYLSQSHVLPHASATINHGGFSTNLGALWHGVPSVVIPLFGDHFENAQRYAEAGVAIRLRLGTTGPGLLRKTLQRVLEDEAIRANTSRIQARLKASGGPGLAADLLIRLAATRQPVLREESKP